MAIKNIEYLERGFAEISNEVLEMMSEYVGRKLNVSNMTQDEITYALMLSDIVSYRILFQGDPGFREITKGRYGVSREQCDFARRSGNKLYNTDKMFQEMADTIIENISHDFAVERHCKARGVKLRFMRKQLKLLQDRIEKLES